MKTFLKLPILFFIILGISNCTNQSTTESNSTTEVSDTSDVNSTTNPLVKKYIITVFKIDNYLNIAVNSASNIVYQSPYTEINMDPLNIDITSYLQRGSVYTNKIYFHCKNGTFRNGSSEKSPVGCSYQMNVKSYHIGKQDTLYSPVIAKFDTTIADQVSTFSFTKSYDIIYK